MPLSKQATELARGLFGEVVGEGEEEEEEWQAMSYWGHERGR